MNKKLVLLALLILLPSIADAKIIDRGVDVKAQIGLGKINTEQDPNTTLTAADGYNQFLQVPEVANSDQITCSSSFDGGIWYDSTDSIMESCVGGSKTSLSAGAAATTLDEAYTAGNTIDADASGDIEIDLTVTARKIQIANTFAGTQAIALEIDAEAAQVITDGLLFTCSAGTITDAVDASHASITNAINVGDNVIKGADASIDFTEFDVASGTGSVTINDGGDLGALTVEGTVLDINSLTFVGAGEVATAASTALTLNVAGGDAAGEDLIVDAHNMQFTATGAMDLTPDGAVTLAIDLTDTNYTNAISVADNAILGTTGVINYDNFDVAADGDVDCVDLDASGNVSVTGDFDVSGVSTFSTGTWTTDNVVAKTGGGSLGLDGQAGGGIVLQGNATGGITLSTDTTVTTDFVVNGGDFTMTSAIASKPNLLYTNSVVGTTGSVTTYDHTRGGVASVDGDDIHTDIFNGYDNGPAADTFASVLYEITDVTAGTEDGNITWKVVSAGNDWNFLELDGIGGVEINSGTEDIDVHIDGDEGADLLLVDASENHIVLTRAFAAGATTSAEIFTVSQTSATGDNGCATFDNAAAASATEPTVTIHSSATGIVQSSLLVDHDGTAGASGLGAVRIDSDDVNNAALYVTSPVTEAGTSTIFDETVVTFVAEGVGGALSLYRNVTSATKAVLLVEDDHADSTGPLATFTYDGDDTADDVAVTFEATAALYDEAVVAVVNAGVGRAFFVDHNIATGDTLEPAFEVDSQSVDTAAAVFRAPVDATGTDSDFDDYVVGISAEGVGGGLHIHRAVDDPTGHLVFIEGDLANLTTSNANLLRVSTVADADVTDSVVEFITTDAAHDQAVLQVTQAGTGATTPNILVDGATPLVVIGDAGEEDAQINFDGNELDFHVGLDDTANSLILGKGTALGTTPAITIDTNQVVTIDIALNIPVETVATTNTITEFEGGKIFFLSHDTESVTTLPDAASSAGMKIRFIIADAPETDDYTIVTEGSVNELIGGINELETDTGTDGPYIGNGDLITFVRAVSVLGDWVELYCDGNNWYFTGQANADGGITLGST